MARLYNDFFLAVAKTGSMSMLNMYAMNVVVMVNVLMRNKQN